MQTAETNLRTVQRQRWQENFPTQVLTFIAAAQMLVTLAIIGSETWSMLVNLKRSFLFIGYAGAFVFTITWISTFIVVCCKRGSQGCTIHALVENILSVAASSVLLYYNVQFLQNPLKCFWPGNICTTADWKFLPTSWWDNDYVGIQDAKLVAIKIQLSCVSAMLSLSLVFILTYLYTSLQVKNRTTVVAPQGTIEFRQQEQLPPQSAPVWAVQMPVWTHP